MSLGVFSAFVIFSTKVGISAEAKDESAKRLHSNRYRPESNESTFRVDNLVRVIMSNTKSFRLALE